MEEQIRSIIGLSNTYIGEAPIDLDNCQWIKPMSGRSKVHFGNGTYDYPNYVICCRGKNQQEVRRRINVAYKSLQNYVGNNYVILIRRLPYYLGRDDNYRVIYKFEIEYQVGGY